MIDSTMLDGEFTPPRSGAKPGGPVTLWGDGLAVEEIALRTETIHYNTLVSGVTQRVQVAENSML